jgi:hypothetical protein
MTKVKKQFFCTQEKKTYFVGEEYTGDRKDLSHVLELEDKNLAPKATTKKRPAKRRKTKK